MITIINTEIQSKFTLFDTTYLVLHTYTFKSFKIYIYDYDDSYLSTRTKDKKVSVHLVFRKSDQT